MRQRPILLQLQIFIVCDSKAWRRMNTCLLLRAVITERIGERHASACRYKNELPEGLTPLLPDAIYDPNHVPVFLKSYGVHTVHTKQDEFTFEQLVIGNSGQIAHHWMYSQLRFNFVRTQDVIGIINLAKLFHGFFGITIIVCMPQMFDGIDIHRNHTDA